MSRFCNAVISGWGEYKINALFVERTCDQCLYKSIYKVYTLDMKTKIQKWGNSLGVRLPKSITEQKALQEGTGVTVLLQNDQIVIEPEKEASLGQLLASVTPANLHTETDWQSPQGQEVW